MTDLKFIAQHLVATANQLDAEGRFAAANRVERYAEHIVTAGFGGGMAEYVGRLLELARNKGIDYMQSRMGENRIVILNDGTPVMKENDKKEMIDAVVSRARQLKLPETKGLVPNAPRKFDSKWSAESDKRQTELESGKSPWLDQAKPYSDAMTAKHLNKYRWDNTEKASKSLVDTGNQANQANQALTPSQKILNTQANPTALTRPRNADESLTYNAPKPYPQDEFAKQGYDGIVHPKVGQPRSLPPTPKFKPSLRNSLTYNKPSEFPPDDYAAKAYRALNPQ